MNKEELTFLHHFIFEFTAPGIAPFFGILHSLGKDYKKSTIRPSDILETRMVVLLYSTRKKMRNICTNVICTWYGPWYSSLKLPILQKFTFSSYFRIWVEKSGAKSESEFLNHQNWKKMKNQNLNHQEIFAYQSDYTNICFHCAIL